MSYSARNYRHRNPKGKEEKQAKTPFFKAPKNALTRKKKVQRLATSKEDEKLGTNDARMEKDKEEPLKPVQKKGAPEKGKKEEEKPVRKAEKPKKEKEDKAVQKKEKPKKEKEEKAVQKKDAPKKGKKEQEKPVQKKEKEGKTSSPVAEEIKRQSGKGSPLPEKILAEMSKSFGVDLIHVRIHADGTAAKLCQELHAVAFTHGVDIFFDEGKYNPESPEGKALLAHELTHVVQQSNTDN